MPGSLLGISILMIVICMQFIRKDTNAPRKKHLSHLILYLFTISFIKIGNLLFDLFYYQSNNTGAIVALITISLDSLVFIARLLEPNIRSYLKSCFLYYRAKMRYYCIKTCKRSTTKDTILNFRPSCDVIFMFEELEREAIEYQLIAISIIMFKSYFGTCIASINTTYRINSDDHVNYSREIQAIKSYDLGILNDTCIEEKCNL
jgi:hypothetical protein